VRDLSVMIRVLDPDADRSLVRRMQANLARRAPPTRAKRERMIAPSLLFAAGLARMDRIDHEQHRKLDVRNVRYRDGLLLAILAARGLPARQPRADARRLAHQQDRRGLRL
jgi:hypothetical protein